MNGEHKVGTGEPSTARSAGGGMPRILLTDDEAAAALGVSKRTFHDLRAEAFMPKAIALGPRLLRWSIDELRNAVANMPRLKVVEEPVELAKARAARSGRTDVK